MGLLGVAEGPAGVPGVATSGKEGIGFGGLLLLLGASCSKGKIFLIGFFFFFSSAK